MRLFCLYEDNNTTHFSPFLEFKYTTSHHLQQAGVDTEPQ